MSLGGPTGSGDSWPDLTLCKGDRLLFRELKAGAQVTSEQQAWCDALAAAGQDWTVWRPCDWYVIEATLKGQLGIGGAS